MHVCRYDLRYNVLLCGRYESELKGLTKKLLFSILKDASMQNCKVINTVAMVLAIPIYTTLPYCAIGTGPTGSSITWLYSSDVQCQTNTISRRKCAVQ